MNMEEKISGAIVRSYFKKLENHLAVDVAIVGAGPSGLVAARDLALAGLKVAVFESKLARNLGRRHADERGCRSKRWRGDFA